MKHAAHLPLLLAVCGALGAVLHQGCSSSRPAPQPVARLAARDDGAPRVCPMIVGDMRPFGPEPLMNGEGIHNARVAVSAYLVRAHGMLFLVDGGLVPVNEMAWFFRLTGGHPAYDIPDHASAVHQLREAGIDPESLAFIVATHAHGDHAGIAESFPRTPLIMSDDEARWVLSMPRPKLEVMTWRDSGAWTALMERVRTVRWDAEFHAFPSFALFADGSVTLLHTPGHTPGSMTIMLRGDDGKRALLLGDAALTPESIRRDVPAGVLSRQTDSDAELAARTLHALHGLVGDDPSWTLMTAHDARLLGARHTFTDCVREQILR